MRETGGSRPRVYFKLFDSSGLRDLDGVELVDLFGDEPSPYQHSPLLAFGRVSETYPFGEQDIPLTPSQDVGPHRETCLVAPARYFHLVVLSHGAEVEGVANPPSKKDLGRGVLRLDDLRLARFCVRDDYLKLRQLSNPILNLVIKAIVTPSGAALT